MLNKDPAATRRSVLQTLAMTPLGVSIASGVHSHFPSAPLKIGFVGVANRGETNLFSLRDEQVAALCDVDANHLKAAGKMFPTAKTFRDFRKMLSEVRLDAVVVSTPDHTHAVIARLALESGLHVYCEKPLAHGHDECDQLNKLASKTKVVAQLGNQHHSEPGYQAAISILRSGMLGKIQAVHAWTDRPIWKQGLRLPLPKAKVPEYLDWELWLGPAPKRPYHASYHPRMWRGWWDFGGGALADMGPHLLDPVLFSLPIEVKSVQAKADGLTKDSPPVSSHVTWKVEAAGREFNIHWYDGQWAPTREQLSLPTLPGNGVLVEGDEARLFFGSHGARPFLLPARGAKGRPQAVSLPKPQDAHIRQWAAACKGEAKRNPCDFSYGARLTQFCQLGNVAIRRGIPLQVAKGGKKFVDAAANQFLLTKYRDGWHK